MHVKFGTNAKVSLVSKHMWEEPCISGKNGSGTVFFSGCNLKCVFCQNYKISQEKSTGKEVSTEELAEIFLFSQKDDVHNINLVSPTSYIYHIKEAINLAKSKGLSIPVVYNTNSYENEDSIKELNGLIDVYLADLKYYDDDLAFKYSGAPNYFEHATKAILQMYYQVGKTAFFDNGLMKKGLIIRHLVLPRSNRGLKKNIELDKRKHS